MAFSQSAGCIEPRRLGNHVPRFIEGKCCRGDSSTRSFAIKQTRDRSLMPDDHHCGSVGDMTITQYLAQQLQAEAKMTRALLAVVPNDKLSFTPGHGLHTIAWNAAHLAEILSWVDGTLNQDGLDMASFDGPPPAEPTDIAGVLKTFDAHLAQAIKVLEIASDAKLAEPWTMRHGDQVWFTIPKGDCLHKWVFTHTAHHRAVLSTQLRLAGVAHGSIYEQ